MWGNTNLGELTLGLPLAGERMVVSTLENRRDLGFGHYGGRAIGVLKGGFGGVCGGNEGSGSSCGYESGGEQSV